MTLKKLILGLVLVVSTSAFSQKWAVDMGEKLTAKLNTTLTESSEDYALSEEQHEKIAVIYKDLMLEKAAIKKELEKEGTFSKESFWKATFPQSKASHIKIREILEGGQKRAFNESLQKKH